MIDINKLDQLINVANDCLYDQTEEEEIIFSYSTNGYTNSIELFGIYLTGSEDVDLSEEENGKSEVHIYIDSICDELQLFIDKMNKIDVEALREEMFIKANNWIDIVKEGGQPYIIHTI